MYIYNYGAIGETVRTKIDGYKQKIRGGESNDSCFGDVLKTYLTERDKEKKVVSALGNNTFENDTSVQSLSGSTLLYAMGNLETDDIAGKVLSSLGFTASSDSVSPLKTAADELSVSAKQLIKANASGGDTTVAASEFVSDYNKLMNVLNSQGTSSAYLYKTALNAAVTAGGESLAAVGVTLNNGQLNYSAGANIPDSFINAVASSSAMISSYASALGSDESDENGGISEYYATLMNSMI